MAQTSPFLEWLGGKRSVNKWLEKMEEKGKGKDEALKENLEDLLLSYLLENFISRYLDDVRNNKFKGIESDRWRFIPTLEAAIRKKDEIKKSYKHVLDGFEKEAKDTFIDYIMLMDYLDVFVSMNAYLGYVPSEDVIFANMVFVTMRTIVEFLIEYHSKFNDQPKIKAIRDIFAHIDGTDVLVEVLDGLRKMRNTFVHVDNTVEFFTKSQIKSEVEEPYGTRINIMFYYIFREAIKDAIRLLNNEDIHKWRKRRVCFSYSCEKSRLESDYKLLAAEYIKSSQQVRYYPFFISSPKSINDVLDEIDNTGEKVLCELILDHLLTQVCGMNRTTESGNIMTAVLYWFE